MACLVSRKINTYHVLYHAWVCLKLNVSLSLHTFIERVMHMSCFMPGFAPILVLVLVLKTYH